MNFFNWLNERNYFGSKAAGSIIYAKKEKKFLVLERGIGCQEPGTWSIVVSGKQDDKDNNSKITAIREFKEELKYSKNFEITDKPFDYFKDKDFRFSTYIITVDKTFKPHLNWEHSNYKWIKSLDEIPNPIHFGTKRLLTKIKNKFKL